MRRFDKKKNIQKANLLAEQRYVEIKEGVEKTDSDIDDLARDIIRMSGGDYEKENELIVKTANGDEEIQRRLTNRVSKLKLG
jgi:hypothetical protein